MSFGAIEKQPAETAYVRPPKEGELGLLRAPSLDSLVREAVEWSRAYNGAERARNSLNQQTALFFRHQYGQLADARARIQEMIDTGKDLTASAAQLGDWYVRTFCTAACSGLWREVLAAPKPAQHASLPTPLVPNFADLLYPDNPLHANMYATPAGLDRLGMAVPDPGQELWYEGDTVFAKVQPAPAEPTERTRAGYARHARLLGISPEFPVHEFATIVPYLSMATWQAMTNPGHPQA